jgi:Tol biopolymer transport system component
MKSDGTGEKQITFTDDWQEGGAQFLPDGETILYRAWKRQDQGGRITPMEIFTVRRDGSGMKQVTNDPGKTHWAPFPAPDGKHFAYVKVLMPEGGGRPNWEIALRHLETGEERQLTFHPGFDGFPAFSPDGKWMTFSSSREAAPGTRALHQYMMDVSSLGLSATGR